MQNNSLFLRARYNDHLKWSGELIESIATGHEFTGELNHNETEFAKWYYSFSGTLPYYDLDPEQKKIFDKIGPANLRLHNTARLMNGVTTRTERLQIFNNQTKKYLVELQKLITAYIRLNHEHMKSYEARLNSYSLMIRITGASAGLIIIVMISWLGWRIIRSMLINLDNMSRSFSQLTRQNLKTRIDVITDDEYGKLAGEFNYFVETISQIIGDVKQNSRELSLAARSINEVVEGFSDNVQHQASFAEEIHTTMNEISTGMSGISNAASDQSESLSSLTTIIEELTGLIIKMDS